MPFRSHRSRDEPVREGIYYNPSSGWQSRRPSRAHGHGHRRTTSLHGPLPQARQLDFHTARQLDFHTARQLDLHTARQLDLHTSYHPGYTESRQQQSPPSSAYTYRQRWQTEEFGVSPFDNAAYTHDMHWRGERHRIHPLDNPRHPGEAQHENHYSYDYQEEYHVPERPQRNPRSRSASPPQNRITSPNSEGNAAERCVPSAKQARQDARSNEAAHVDKKTKRAEDRARLLEIIDTLINIRLAEERNEENERNQRLSQWQEE